MTQSESTGKRPNLEWINVSTEARFRRASRRHIDVWISKVWNLTFSRRHSVFRKWVHFLNATAQRWRSSHLKVSSQSSQKWRRWCIREVMWDGRRSKWGFFAFFQLQKHFRSLQERLMEFQTKVTDQWCYLMWDRDVRDDLSFNFLSVCSDVMMTIWNTEQHIRVKLQLKIPTPPPCPWIWHNGIWLRDANGPYDLKNNKKYVIY